MSKNRIKIARPVIQTRSQMETLVGEIRALKIREAQIAAERDKRIKLIDDEYQPELAAVMKSLDEKISVAQDWAEGNPSEFNGAKSIDMVHGVVGWRTGQWQARTLSGFTWDRVLEKIGQFGKAWREQYIRVKEEVNKQALIGDREKTATEDLRSIGVRFVQEESFYVEPKLTEVETRETVEA